MKNPKKEQEKQAQIQINAANEALKIDANNIEAKERLAAAENNLISIREDVNGQLSEQKTNAVALQNEQQALIDSRIKGENDAALQEALRRSKSYDDEQKAYNDFFAKEKQRLEDKKSLLNEGTQAYQDVIQEQRELENQQANYVQDSEKAKQEGIAAIMEDAMSKRREFERYLRTREDRKRKTS